MQRLLLIIIGICVFPTNVSAHTNKSWLTGDTLEIVDNTSPASANLPYTEHLFSRNLIVGETVTLTLQPEQIPELAGLAANYVWTDSTGQSYTGKQIKLTSAKTGNFILSIEFSHAGQTLFSEEIAYQVGDLPTKPEILVNNIVTPSQTTAQISRSSLTKLAVREPIPGYQYQWDLITGGIQTGPQVDYQFTNTSLPGFITLRATNPATNTFVDSYVRIDSQEQVGFRVIPPSIPYVAEQSSTTRHFSFPTPFVLALLALVTILTIIVCRWIKFNQQRKHEESN
jgi:hypothetical protein